jgi:transcription elongation GreA/GreB family factor
LSDQLNKARILTANDISTEEVGVGCVVACKSSQNKKITYTLLGPWDATPEENVLAFQSKLAQAMKGLTPGEKFQFQGETFTITGISSYL